MLDTLRKELDAAEVHLVAVSKTKPIEAIKNIYDAGHKVFGENRALELRDKEAELPKDIEWHMIGHLQKNKVKYIARFVHMIHSVDSLALLKAINKEAKKHDRKIKVLLQLKIAREESKYGLSISDALEILNTDDYIELENIEVVGVMGMATFTSDLNEVRSEFRNLNDYFNILKEAIFQNDEGFEIKSMGMSGDYKVAIEEGSNMVRIGSMIFGTRN